MELLGKLQGFCKEFGCDTDPETEYFKPGTLKAQGIVRQIPNYTPKGYGNTT